MARVTVEDCLKHVDNRFDLVLKAAERAHALELGAAEPTVPKDNDKPTVIALREIAAGRDFSKTAANKTSFEESDRLQAATAQSLQENEKDPQS